MSVNTLSYNFFCGKVSDWKITPTLSDHSGQFNYEVVFLVDQKNLDISTKIKEITFFIYLIFEIQIFFFLKYAYFLSKDHYAETISFEYADFWPNLRH